MKEFFVREAAAGDGAGIAPIAENDLGYPCTGESVEEALKGFLFSENDKVFVAESDGRIIGFAHGNIYRTLYMSPLVNLMGIAVSDEFRGSGVGTALLSEIENWCKAVGAAGVRVNSSGKRIQAHKFYRDRGYNSEKEQKRFLKYV